MGQAKFLGKCTVAMSGKNLIWEKNVPPKKNIKVKPKGLNNSHESGHL